MNEEYVSPPTEQGHEMSRTTSKHPSKSGKALAIGAGLGIVGLLGFLPAMADTELYSQEYYDQMVELPPVDISAGAVPDTPARGKYFEVPPDSGTQPNPNQNVAKDTPPLGSAVSEVPANSHVPLGVGDASTASPAEIAKMLGKQTPPPQKSETQAMVTGTANVPTAAEVQPTPEAETVPQPTESKPLIVDNSPQLKPDSSVGALPKVEKKSADGKNIISKEAAQNGQSRTFDQVRNIAQSQVSNTATIPEIGVRHLTIPAVLALLGSATILVASVMFIMGIVRKNEA